MSITDTRPVIETLRRAFHSNWSVVPVGRYVVITDETCRWVGDIRAVTVAELESIFATFDESPERYDAICTLIPSFRRDAMIPDDGAAAIRAALSLAEDEQIITV